jgi:hypothetical protein
VRKKRELFLSELKPGYITREALPTGIETNAFIGKRASPEALNQEF